MNVKYRIVQTGKFKKDLKLIRKRGYDLSLLGVVVDMLAAGDELPGKYRDHSLSGIFSGAGSVTLRRIGCRSMRSPTMN